MRSSLLVFTLAVSSTIFYSDSEQLASNRFISFGNVMNAFSNALESPADMARGLIKDSFPVKQPHQNIVVQTSTDLCAAEKNFTQNRSCHTQQALTEHFGINKPLKLAFCCSGGGNRAMVGTLGLMTAAAKSKLLDATTYVAGLSGSTWLLAPFSFLATNSNHQKSFEDTLNLLRQSYYKMLDDYSMISFLGVNTPPLLSFESTDDFLVEVAKRFAYDQTFTLVNLFGYIVGDFAMEPMGNDRVSEKFSTMADKLEQGTIPMPLYSAIFESDTIFDKPVYEWFEVSPVEAGSASLGYIPVEYLGSGFEHGILDRNNLCHEYPISFFLGMFGSAFAATIQEISELQKALKRKETLFKDMNLESVPHFRSNRNFLIENNFVQGVVKDLIADTLNCRNPLTYARFPNYSKGLGASVIKDHSEIGLFDAGIDFDLPLPLLVDRPEREMDIVILYDSHPGNISILEQLATYCRKKHIKFPSLHVSQSDLRNNVITILNDPRSFDYDKNMTTYIYLPTNDVNIYTAPYITFNFKYTNEEIDMLSDKIENALLSQMDTVQEVMRLVAEKRYAE